METVIVAFEGEKTGRRIREILENSGTADCLLCRSAAEVKRAAGSQQIAAVISGFKFPDGCAQALYDDLPAGCAMLLLAMQSQLELCENEDIVQLASPVSKGDLIAAVRMLLQTERPPAQLGRPRRSEKEQELIARAKELLMDRYGMTEAQAHRFLQRRSMARGVKLWETARLVLGEG